MPWQEVQTMELREQFVRRASEEGVSMTAVCAEFQISRKTGYKWFGRYQAQGPAGLLDHSRRPQRTPTRTPAVVEQQVLLERDRHPAWGARKLAHVLARRGLADVPSISTITAILTRHGRIDPVEAVKHRAYQRFEAVAPNALWQLDFKGYRPLSTGTGSCHPLSVLDDHSRWVVGLVACGNQQTATVQQALIGLFREVGLPQRILTDNGPPWGSRHPNSLTRLEVWLLRLGITIGHGRPWHPQTQGKVERFHRTLSTELGLTWPAADLVTCQARFDAWRSVYNHERPHEALGMAVPASRYRPSPRPYPEQLNAFEYGPGAITRIVQANGWLHYLGGQYRLSHALHGERVALRPSAADGVLQVLLGCHQVAILDLRHGAMDAIIRIRKVL